MTVSLPEPSTWIVAPSRLNEVGEQLLEVSMATLALYGLDDRYERQVISHGVTPVIEPSKAKQIVITGPRVFVGRAGEQTFQFFKGEPGMLGFQVAVYTVSVSHPWPLRQSNQTALSVPAITAAREGLWADAFVVWQGLLALALGGVQTTPAISTSPAGVAVGPMEAREPSGGAATYQIAVQVAL